jgi:hypothetical protein
MAQNNRIVFQNKLNKSINVKNSKNLLLNKNVMNINNNNIPPIISFKKLPIEFYYFLVEKNIEYHLNKDNKLFIKINNNYYFVSNINAQYKQYLPNFVFKNIIPNDIDIIDWYKTPHYISSLLDIVMIQSYYFNDDNHDLTKLKDFEYNTNELKTNSTINHFPLNYIHYQNTLYFIPYNNNKDYLSFTTNELTKIYYPLVDIIKNYPNRIQIEKINDFINLYYTFDNFISLMNLDKQTLYKLYLQKSLDNLFIKENKIFDNKVEINKQLDTNVINKNNYNKEQELTIDKDNYHIKILCICEYDKDISNNLYIEHFIKYYQLFCNNIMFDNKFRFVNHNLLNSNDFEYIEIDSVADKQKIFDIYKDKYDWIFFVKINEFLFFKKDILIDNNDNKLENKIKSFYLYKSFLKKCKKFSFVKIHHHTIQLDSINLKSNFIEIIIDKILNNQNITDLDNKSYIFNTKLVDDITKYTNTLNKINTNIYQIKINENQSKVKVISNTKKITSKYKIVSQLKSFNENNDIL